MIALVDYGAGNLTSVRKALAALGAPFESPASPAVLATADAIVVPGVGHFGATESLDARWRGVILERVERGVPLLGICLGMQWLFEGSDEAPGLPGLGLIAGRVRLLDRSPAPGLTVKVPHVGWNGLDDVKPSRLLAGIAPGAQVYFTHSYAAPVGGGCVAVTTHGAPFAAVVERGRIFGVQFHPEKSSDTGLRILRNFTELAADPPRA